MTTEITASEYAATSASTKATGPQGGLSASEELAKAIFIEAMNRMAPCPTVRLAKNLRDKEYHEEVSLRGTVIEHLVGRTRYEDKRKVLYSNNLEATLMVLLNQDTHVVWCIFVDDVPIYQFGMSAFSCREPPNKQDQFSIVLKIMKAYTDRVVE